VAKSAEAAQHIDIECFGHDLRIHPRAKPVPARRSAPSKHLASKSFGTQAWSSA